MEVYDAHFPAPKMTHVVQEWCKACCWWLILIGKLLIMGTDFFHWEMTCPTPMAAGQLSPPEKEKWVVKTGLGASKGGETFELLRCHLPKQVARWFLQSSVAMQEAFSQVMISQTHHLTQMQGSLSASLLWMKEREEKKGKKRKRHGSISWWWEIILFVIGYVILPKMQQDEIVSNKERSLIIIDSHPFDRRELRKWSMNTG